MFTDSLGEGETQMNRGWGPDSSLFPAPIILLDRSPSNTETLNSGLGTPLWLADRCGFAPSTFLSTTIVECPKWIPGKD